MPWVSVLIWTLALPEPERIDGVPPVTALMGWALFGEAIGPTTVAGMALVAAGVVAVTRAPPATPRPAPTADK